VLRQEAHLAIKLALGRAVVDSADPVAAVGPEAAEVSVGGAAVAEVVVPEAEAAGAQAARAVAEDHRAVGRREWDRSGACSA